MLLLIARPDFLFRICSGLFDYLLINDNFINVCLNISSVGAAVCLVLFILFQLPTRVNEGNHSGEQKRVLIICTVQLIGYSYVAAMVAVFWKNDLKLLRTDGN